MYRRGGYYPPDGVCLREDGIFPYDFCGLYIYGRMVSSPLRILREDDIFPYGIIVPFVGADIIRPMGIKKEATKGRPYEILKIIQ